MFRRSCIIIIHRSSHSRTQAYINIADIYVCSVCSLASYAPCQRLESETCGMDLSWEEVGFDQHADGELPENQEPHQCGTAFKKVAPLGPQLVHRFGCGPICFGKRKMFENEALHLLECPKGYQKCGLCRYLKLGPKWSKRLRMQSEDSRSAWIGSIWHGKQWGGVGCAACHAEHGSSTMGQMSHKRARSMRLFFSCLTRSRMHIEKQSPSSQAAQCPRGDRARQRPLISLEFWRRGDPWEVR